MIHYAVIYNALPKREYVAICDSKDWLERLFQDIINEVETLETPEDQICEFIEENYCVVEINFTKKTISKIDLIAEKKVVISLADHRDDVIDF